MILLRDLLYRAPLLHVLGPADRDVARVQADSRAVQPGDLFVAVRGVAVDGHQYIAQAVAAGAVAVVCEDIPADPDPAITYIRVANSADTLSLLAANYHGNPAESLTLVGVTGTNGKTTVATLLYELFKRLGYRTGLVSTVVVRVHEQTLPATHTTPDPLSLQALFRQMVDAGCTHCFMEVSSHALDQSRVAGVPFRGAVFTNLTHDHLDYHKTFDNYLRAKRRLFDELPARAFALSNADDRNGHIMLQNSRARRVFYSLETITDYTARLIENRIDGLLLHIGGQDVWFRLAGAFNAYNLLAVYATACLLGEDSNNILEELSALESVNGRFQLVPLPGGITGVVDYAHTPDALLNILRTLRESLEGAGRIVLVVGCGGNRDTAKRPEMGRIAAEGADLVVFTSDNPRNEDPEAILREIEAGVPIGIRRKTLTITNRREAIRAAARLCQPDDVLLVAGKGHETYQEIASVRHPFDDRQELLAAFDLAADNETHTL